MKLVSCIHMEIVHFIIVMMVFSCIFGSGSCQGTNHEYDNNDNNKPENLKHFNRSSFPDDFVFGAASSSYQSEGAIQYGRGPSMWDTFTHDDSEKIQDHSTGDVADGFYYHYKDDVALMNDIGFDAFRISISWSRLLPKGRISGGVNTMGVDFYNNLIDDILDNGLQPYVTLFHWDFPQVLIDEYGGLLSSRIMDDYVEYAEFCFKTFGDRVKKWITVNEPYEFSFYGYGNGEFAPGRCSPHIGNCNAGDSATEPYIVAHHLLLSHAAAVEVYRNKFKASQRGQIGITLSSKWFVPFSENAAGRSAASRALDFTLGWFLHPITFGDYPSIMRSIVGNRLPSFSKNESDLLKKSFDFLGFNYYTAIYAADAVYLNKSTLSMTTDDRVVLSEVKNGVLIGQPTDLSWLHICPWGLRKLMLYMKRNYDNPTIIVTENGMSQSNNATLSIEESLNDAQRILYHHEHLIQLLKAIKKGVNVKGYFIWSLLDDFEWNLGYTARFGITYVDFKNGLKRYPKHSAIWFNKFLREKDMSSSLQSNADTYIRIKPMYSHYS